jgi:hypothetical protein
VNIKEWSHFIFGCAIAMLIMGYLDLSEPWITKLSWWVVVVGVMWWGRGWGAAIWGTFHRTPPATQVVHDSLRLDILVVLGTNNRWAARALGTTGYGPNHVQAIGDLMLALNQHGLLPGLNMNLGDVLRYAVPAAPPAPAPQQAVYQSPACDVSAQQVSEVIQLTPPDDGPRVASEANRAAAQALLNKRKRSPSPAEASEPAGEQAAP